MKQRKIFDISISLRPSMPTWPGDPGFQRSFYSSFEEGGPYEASVITMGSHTGTHVDAPGHFVPGGPTVDMLPLDILTGNAVVVASNAEREITRADIERLDLGNHIRILFKTRNSSLYQSDEFIQDYVYFTADAAQYLVERGVKLVGIDYLSVGEYHAGADAHQVFLKNGVVIVETLDLSQVEAGAYELICLPLKILGGDGSPARVVLISP